MENPSRLNFKMAEVYALDNNPEEYHQTDLQCFRNFFLEYVELEEKMSDQNFNIDDTMRCVSCHPMKVSMGSM
jgi:hypothetical protein